MSAEKRRVEKVVRQFRAFCLLSCSLTPDLRADIDRDIQSIPEMHKRELMELEAHVTATVNELSQPLRLIARQPAEFRFPAVVRVCGNAVGATEIVDLSAVERPAAFFALATGFLDFPVDTNPR